MAETEGLRYLSLFDSDDYRVQESEFGLKNGIVHIVNYQELLLSERL